MRSREAEVMLYLAKAQVRRIENIKYKTQERNCRQAGSRVGWCNVKPGHGSGDAKTVSIPSPLSHPSFLPAPRNDIGSSFHQRKIFTLSIKQKTYSSDFERIAEVFGNKLSHRSKGSFKPPFVIYPCNEGSKRCGSITISFIGSVVVTWHLPGQILVADNWIRIIWKLTLWNCEIVEYQMSLFFLHFSEMAFIVQWTISPLLQSS